MSVPNYRIDSNFAFVFFFLTVYLLRKTKYYNGRHDSYPTPMMNIVLYVNECSQFSVWCTQAIQYQWWILCSM